MKKTIITALIALLIVLAFASCEGFFSEPGAEQTQYTYTEDGEQLVTVKVNTGGTAGSRSLTDALARSEAIYVEVIFKYTDPDTTDTTYYRADGYYGPTLKVKIPVASYDPADNIDNPFGNDAIILIGKKSDGTLLATGVLDASYLVVDDTIDKVEFTVESLTADIHATISSEINHFFCANVH